MSKHVQPCPCHSYWATRVGWTRFAKRIVTMVTTMTLVTLEKQGPSWYILMPLEVELIWTSENHSQKGVLKCTWALEVSKHWNYYWCLWCRFAKPVDKQLRASEIYDLTILSAWNTSMVKDYRLITTSTTCFSSRWYMSEVLEAKSPTVRMTMLTPLHQELQGHHP